MKVIPREQIELVEETGFAKFNRYPHLCVDVPDGGYTITCRTTEGRKVTFSFMPYRTGGPPQCVDIQHHTADHTTLNGNTKLPIQEINVFSKGRDAFRSYAKDEKPATLVSLIFSRKEVVEVKEGDKPASPAKVAEFLDDLGIK